MYGEGFLERGGDELGGFFAVAFGDVGGFLWDGVDLGDAEVAALGVEASAIGGIGDMPLDAIGAVESDAEGILAGWFDEKAIAIAPSGFLEGAIGVGGERLLRHRGGEAEQEAEDGTEVIHGTRPEIYHEEGALSRHWSSAFAEASAYVLLRRIKRRDKSAFAKASADKLVTGAVRQENDERAKMLGTRRYGK